MIDWLQSIPPLTRAALKPEFQGTSNICWRALNKFPCPIIFAETLIIGNRISTFCTSINITDIRTGRTRVNNHENSFFTSLLACSLGIIWFLIAGTPYSYTPSAIGSTFISVDVRVTRFW